LITTVSLESRESFVTLKIRLSMDAGARESQRLRVYNGRRVLKRSRVVLISVVLASGMFAARAGKYWVCNHPSHKTAKQDQLSSLCMPSPQAEREAAEHRKIHPNNVIVYTCVM
jgi:hypothetical protein